MKKQTLGLSLNLDDPFQENLGQALTGWNQGFKTAFFLSVCKQMLKGTERDVRAMRARMREIVYGVDEQPIPQISRAQPVRAVEPASEPAKKAAAPKQAKQPCGNLFVD